MEHKGQIIIKIEDAELMNQLVKYKNTLGWTWKRIFLIGFADLIAKQGNNPDLILNIAEYIETGR